MPNPSKTPSQGELNHGESPSGSEHHVEKYSVNSHVRTVEDGPPGKNSSDNSQDQGEGHVGPAADGLVVEGGILGGHNADCYQQGDSGVVDAGKSLHDGLVSNCREGVPNSTTQHSLGRGEEEKSVNHLIRQGVALVDLRVGVDIECECNHHNEPESV